MYSSSISTSIDINNNNNNGNNNGNSYISSYYCINRILVLFNLLLLFILFLFIFNEDILYNNHDVYNNNNNDNNDNNNNNNGFKEFNGNKDKVVNNNDDNKIGNKSVNVKDNNNDFISSIIPLYHAHSYKDNLRDRPFFDAFEYGFCSFGIEIQYSHVDKDIYIIKDENTNDNNNNNNNNGKFDGKNRFKNVYLEPLINFINKKERPVFFDKSISLGICKQLTLFVTLDPNFQEQSWLILEKLLHDKSYIIKSSGMPLFHQYEKLRDNNRNLEADEDSNENNSRMRDDEPLLSPIRVVVSMINDIQSFSKFVVSKLEEQKISRMTGVEGLGSDVLQWDKNTDQNIKRIQSNAGQIYRSFFQWPGMRGHMEVRAQLRDYKKRMIEYNLPIRLYDSPNDSELWDIMLEEGIDVISTENIEKLKNYLHSYKPKKLPM